GAARSAGEPGERIDGLSLLAQLEIEEGPLQRSRLPHRTDRGAALDLLAGLDVDPLQMPVEGVVAVAVVEDDEVAVAAEPLRPHHLPLVHGDHLGALWRANVDAVVVGDGAELGV